MISRTPCVIIYTFLVPVICVVQHWMFVYLLALQQLDIFHLWFSCFINEIAVLTCTCSKCSWLFSNLWVTSYSPISCFGLDYLTIWVLKYKYPEVVYHCCLLHSTVLTKVGLSALSFPIVFYHNCCCPVAVPAIISLSSSPLEFLLSVWLLISEEGGCILAWYLNFDHSPMGDPAKSPSILLKKPNIWTVLSWLPWHT